MEIHVYTIPKLWYNTPILNDTERNYTMSRWRHEEKTKMRDYDAVALNLIKPLSHFKLYELYGIVHKEK